MKTLVFRIFHIPFGQNALYFGFSILILIFHSLQHFKPRDPSQQKISAIDNGSNPCFIDTRLCGIYGGGTPDVVIGTDINSDNDITDYFTPDAYGTVTPPSNHYIVIQGTLRMNANFRGNSLKLRFGDGAKIIIESGKTFYGSSCKFFSCYDMWRGIEAPSAKSISLISCQIEDAEYALSVGSTVGLGMLNNDFTLNFVGIRNLGGTLKVGACIGNVFRGVEDLNLRPHYNSDTEIIDHYDAGTPYAGILLNNCSANIGRSNGSSSFTFSRVVFGIIANHSTLVVNGANFNHIYGTGADPLGAGIQAENSNVTVNKSNFSDIYFTGVYGFSTVLNISKCTFEHCANGIFSEYNVMGEIINIYDNIFEMNSGSFEDTKTTSNDYENYGIWMSRSAGAPGPINNIESNTFYIGGDNFNAFSAWVTEQSISYGGESIQFRGNKSIITSSEDMVCGYKIQCYQSNFVIIDTDTFIFNNPTRLNMRNAITAHSFGIGHQVLNNRFESTTTRTMNIGFYGGEFANASYCDNYFLNAMESFYFYGNCDRSSLATSTFDNAFRGVFIRDHNTEPGRIGVQDRKGNEWDCNLAVNQWAGYNAGLKPIDSKFWIETTDCHRFPQTGIFPPTWFELSNESEALDCMVPTVADSCGDILGFSLYDWDIISGNYPEGPANGLQIFNADYRLLERLIQDPDLLNCDTLVQNYWNSKSTSTAAELAELLNEIRKAIEIPGSILSDLEEIYESRDELNYSIDTLKENHNWQDSLGLDSIYLAKLDSFLDQLDDIKNQEDSIYEELRVLRYDDLEDLSDANDTITTDSIWETYLKTMNTFVIHVLQGVADSTDYANAEYIAAQDFGEGGPAVLHARVWFEGEDEEESLRKVKKNIGDSEEQFDALIHNKQKNLVEVFPNPGQGSSFIVSANQSIVSIACMDLHGKEVLYMKGSGDQTFIEFEGKDFIPGIYLLKVSLLDGIVETHKIFKN
ncbi:MAG: T9SS type A sorting domain-containing protein [Saprospiraceae bacterium]|nr:T9SS type A sorting domain-containing protein [Saprospiraceae bacterium]